MMHRLFNERSFNIWQIWAKSVNREIFSRRWVAQAAKRAVSPAGLVNKMDEKKAQLDRVSFRIR
jgi:hypothetical protein